MTAGRTTQTELAKELGITQGALSKFEKDLREKGYGTEKQRKYAKAKGLHIVAVELPVIDSN